MDILRILVVGGPGNLGRITSALGEAGHAVIPVDTLADASEALLVQRFEAVLIGSGVPCGDIPSFAAEIKDLNLRSGAESRTAVLSVLSTLVGSDEMPPNGYGIDGFVSETIDADALTLAIARLANAVSAERSNAGVSDGAELPVLDVAELKEQVAYDDELLVELIDLYFSERCRQSGEMKDALADRDFELLSRIAHTIKGSLGSLHAMAAKSDAQDLELASKGHDEQASQRFLDVLERSLDVLEGHLVAVRKSISPS